MDAGRVEAIEAPEVRERDLTQGGLNRDIWHLAVPMILEIGVINFVQILDTYWVGKLGSAALAAVTISVSIRWVMNSLANGLGIGGMAVVARRIGEKDRTAADHAAWQTILLALTVSVVLGGLGFALSRPLLLLLGASGEVLPIGLSYLRVSFAGQFTLILVFAINSLLRGAGEAKLAMTVRFVTTAVTVALEPALIFGWGPLPRLGAVGSAWAIVLGFGAGVVLQMVTLLRGRARIGINGHNLGPDFPLMRRIVTIALPSTVQMTLRASSRLAIVGLVGLYGTFATAAYGVANRLLLIALIPTFGLGNAGGTLVGQNLGAGESGRAERSAWSVTGYAAGYMAITGLILVLFARPLVSVFDATLEVVEIGLACLHLVGPSMVASGVGVVLARAFDGAGNTKPAMAINLLTLWGLEVPIAFALSRCLGMGVNGVWWGRSIANVANGLLFALWFRWGRWKQRDV
jgi:putative MATE family efflux protein